MALAGGAGERSSRSAVLIDDRNNAGTPPAIRGLHSSTFQLNLSHF